MRDEIRHFDLRAIRHNPWILGLACTPFLLCVLAVVLAVIDNPAFLVMTLHGAVAGTMALFTAWTRNPRPRIAPAEVRVERDALWIDGRRIVRDELTGGYLVPRADGVAIRLKRRGLAPDLELLAESEEDGEEVLRSLGLAAEQSVVAFRGMSIVYAHMWKMIAVTFGAFVLALMLGGLLTTLVGGGATPALVLLAVVLCAVLAIVPTRVEVGADGVLTRWMGRERFVRHDDIELAHSSVRGIGRSRRTVVLLQLTNGEEVEIPVSSTTWDDGRAQALAARIHEAMAARTRGDAAAPEAILRRGDREHAAWVRSLRAGTALATHRRAAVTGEQLWRIVEDPGGEPLERAAAAVALGNLEGDQRGRLQRVASATAAPRLRIALDAVVDGEDEEAVGEALAALEHES